MDILLEAEIDSISKVQGVENFGGKSDGAEVKVLRSDNEGEYPSKEFKNYLASKGIKHPLSISGRPEQNRVAERMNQTLTERQLGRVVSGMEGGKTRSRRGSAFGRFLLGSAMTRC